MNTIIRLFITFLKIGTFSFGGGYPMLTMIEREIVQKNKWISSSEFIDITGISQMTPGPIAINSATFVGFKVGGVPGSVFATLGVITTSFLLVSIANHYLAKFKDSNVLKAALMGMRPALTGMIIAAFLSLAGEAYIDAKSMIIGGITLVLLLSKKIHPILTIVFSGVLGMILYGLMPF